MSHLRFRLGALVAVAALGVVGVFAGPAAAANGGNSESAHACQNVGWQDWVREDQTTFTGQGDCVSYAAQGGVLTAPVSPAQLLCESYGGTFGNDDQAGATATYLQIFWTCNDIPLTGGQAEATAISISLHGVCEGHYTRGRYDATMLDLTCGIDRH